MLEAWVNGELRPPKEKGERIPCRDCSGGWIAVIPIENTRHWRHLGTDCDPWSEPETEWHRGWKALFAPDEQEVTVRDELTGTFHRADVLCRRPDGLQTVVEMQHSSITAEEQAEREEFYRRAGTMFWLLHVYDSSSSFQAQNLANSLDFSKPVLVGQRSFGQMRWFGRSSQFIDRWKRSQAHVFLNLGDRVYYLATNAACRALVATQGKGEFALCELTIPQLLNAAKGAGKS